MVYHFSILVVWMTWKTEVSMVNSVLVARTDRRKGAG